MAKNRIPLRVMAVTLALACAGIAAGQSSPLDLEKAPRVQAGPPVNFGTDVESFVTIGEWDFDPISSNTTYSDIAIGGVNALRYKTAGSGFIAGPQLPDGAVLTSFTYHLCDSSAADLHWVAALEACASVDGLCAVLGTPVNSISNVITPCVAYTQDVSGLNYVVNNQTQRLVLIAIPAATDNTNAIAGAVVGYKLQVSPAPALATFGDVPTSHLFFQFIEALARSGITGGCGGGNYCPDNPVTRGQMAVFLAKALGLQFP